MKFLILHDTRAPDWGRDTVYLQTDNWNDYSFVTMFDMSIHDESGKFHEIGATKIGFKQQTTEVRTYSKLPQNFESIESDFFSLGQSVDFYKKIAALPSSKGIKILHALRDIVALPEIIEEIQDEEVFSTSLLRGISLSIIKGQFARVLNGKAELTDFKFKFLRPESKKLGPIELTFEVKVLSEPGTNIHAIIGRNGVGKTTLLNGMIEAITDSPNTTSRFINTESWTQSEITADYFSSLVSVSFSAFDPFTPPREQPDPAKGTCYFYIGLKDPDNEERHRSINDLQKDCTRALISCFSDKKKSDRWFNAINKLGSDENFASMKLEQLKDSYVKIRNKISHVEQSDSDRSRTEYQNSITPFLSRMSSGHAIVLLTITRLVATVEEKTLVLLDEPESHLHPPLLSAFIRALADLLQDRNGVAIIATHSPVVLQEIPGSCGWKIFRKGTDISSSRPTIETFGENVGALTSEVFSLEVERSGFHELLAKSIETGRTYDEIISDYDNQLGFEGRAILQALIANRDRKGDQ